MSCENCEESTYVIDKLAKLLAEIAVIVNGPEPPLTRWSYHDLPEKVRALRQAQQPAAAVPEPMPPVPDSMGLSREQREVEDAFRRGWNSCRARKRMFHCDTHGEWDTMRASGCPDCIAESRRLLRDASTPRWSDEGEPENLMAAAMDALEWLRYLRDLPAGLPLGSANSERMADAVSAIERFVPPNAAIDAMKETP